MPPKKNQASVDLVDLGIPRKVRSRMQPRGSDVSLALSEIAAEKQLNQSKELPRDLQLLLSFRGQSHEGIKNSVLKQLKEDSHCSDVLILRKYPGEVIKVLSLNEAVEKISYSTKGLPGIFDVLTRREPVIVDKNLLPWKNLFYYKPKAIILIPVNIYRYKPKRELLIECIVVLALNDDTKFSYHFVDEFFVRDLIKFCNLTAPLLFNVRKFENAYYGFKHTSEALESIQNVEKEIRDVGSCINTIGLELQSLFHVAHCVVFLILEEPFDSKLIKYASFGGGIVRDHCPDRDCHLMEEVSQQPSIPAGWAAIHKRCLRANDVHELVRFCGRKDSIHSIGGCIVQNIMCFVIDERSGDMPLVVELCNKKGGFTEKDENEAILFSKRVSSVLSSAVMLDYRKRAVRRNVITNELINNIKAARFTKVKHLLDLKFNFTNSFRKKFVNFKYSVRYIDPIQLPGIILYMFTELDFITRWKIRRVTLIRFILSLEQGYRDNPYHNWKHACTVTHFAYVLLKKMRLQKEGFLTDVEAFAFFIACLCHDIDHRGANSRFMSVYSGHESNISYNFHTQEDGLLQRHHLAVTLQILSTDECNIAENMRDNDYREFVEMLQWNIISTDIGRYMINREHLMSTLRHYDKSRPSDRKSLSSVCMSVCDLCETVKPWNDYIHTVRGIFAEFFAQGDEELKLGFTPIPSMDRRYAYIPLIEMKFINEIVRPVYLSLSELLPKIQDCINTIDNCKELWLISTKIFEDYAHVVDPLKILDLIDMREEYLKILAYPELHKHAHLLRQSFGNVLNVPRSSSVASISEPLANFSFHEPEPIPLEIVLKRNCCKQAIRRCLCKHHQGLDDASLLRQCNREGIFMEERHTIYWNERQQRANSNEFYGLDFVMRHRLNSEAIGDSQMEILSQSNSKVITK